MNATKRKTARLDNELNERRRTFCVDLPLVAAKADELGLHQTARHIYAAVREVGYETAAIEKEIGWPASEDRSNG